MTITKADIVDRLPNLFNALDGDPVPADLIGATIVRFGTLAERGLAGGGGLVVQYRPANSECHRTIILEFSEEGMWVSRNLCPSMTNQ